MCTEVGRLPTNDEALRALRPQPQPDVNAQQEDNPAADGIPQVPPVPPQPHPFEILQNAIVAVVWRVNGKKMWFLGCVTHYDKNNPDLATIDYLTRVRPEENAYWRYPNTPDSCETEVQQIMGISTIGKYKLEYIYKSST